MSKNEISLMEQLRWDVDHCVTNHEGERVWLKACVDERGNRIGITDCCPAEYPCDHHKKIANQS